MDECGWIMHVRHLRNLAHQKQRFQNPMRLFHVFMYVESIWKEGTKLGG